MPLLFKLPGNPAGSAGKKISSHAGLVDVAPTILAEAGIAVPEVMQGRSLVSEMKLPAGATDEAAPDRPAYAETDYPHRAFGWSALRAIRAGKYLYIQAPQHELYDQSADPEEKHNLSQTSKAVSATLAAQLNDFRSRTAVALTEMPGLDPEQVKKLEALGYVASDVKTPASNATSGLDPKPRIEVANLLHDSMLANEDGRYEDAVPKLERVLAQQPEMAVAQMQYGIAQARLKNFAKALEPLQKAVKLLPDSGMGHYELGLALYETGDWKSAAPQFEAAVTRAPRWADAHFSLAAVYARIDRVPEAMTELDTALGITAGHYRANLLRGRILSLQGKPADALPNLEKAVEVQPDSREAHLFLAHAYEQLGRMEEAAREQAAAQSATPPARR